MTQIRSFTAITTLTPRAGSPRLSTSYDFTGLGISTPRLKELQSQIDQAIAQWWNSLSRFQRSALVAPLQSSRTLEPSQNPAPDLGFSLLPSEEC